MDSSKPPKQKKCKICKDKFTPFSSLAKVCSATCAIKLTKQENKKEYKATTRKLRTKLNDSDRPYWVKQAEKACHAYIRERDKGKGCISCGTNKPDIQYAAGHYKTKGAHPELRFNEYNIHLQCNKNCNMMLSGNISNYRPRLIDKIGLSHVEWIEGAHSQYKLTINDLKEITQYYKDRLKAITA